MKHTEYLKYEFSDDELKDYAKELARENTVAAEAEEQKKAVVAQFTEKVASAKTKISMLSRYINNGYDHRSVDCSIALNDPKAGDKTIYRDDTGEVVKVCAMSEKEMQESLPFERPATPESSQASAQ